jgi:hypothetical protein
VNAALQAHSACPPMNSMNRGLSCTHALLLLPAVQSLLIIQKCFVFKVHLIKLTRALSLCVYTILCNCSAYLHAGIVCLKFLDPFPVLLSTDGNGHITLWSTCSSSSCKQQLRHLRLHRLHQWQNRQPVSTTNYIRMHYSSLSV